MTADLITDYRFPTTDYRLRARRLQLVDQHLQHARVGGFGVGEGLDVIRLGDLRLLPRAVEGRLDRAFDTVRWIRSARLDRQAIRIDVVHQHLRAGDRSR